MKNCSRVFLLPFLQWFTLLAFQCRMESAYCQIPSQLKPDTSFQIGLLAKVYLLTNPDAKKLSDIKPDKAYSVNILDKVEVSDQQKNFAFTGQAPFLMDVSGEIVIPENRSYLFKLRSSDGSALWIDDKKVVNNDGVHNSTESEAEFDLDAGPHSFVIRHFKTDPESLKELSLSWFEPGKNAFEIIPSEYFRVAKRSVLQAMNSTQPLTILDLKAIGLAPDFLHPSLSKFALHRRNFLPRVGGMDFLSDGSLILSTWDSLGAVYKISKPTSLDTNQIEVKRIAWGLAEPLGLKVVNDRIFVLQKQELTELIDHNADGFTDEYRAVCNAWGATGNFHEFAFGLVFKDGFFYATLAIAIQPGGKSTIPQNKDRGKAIKIGMDGSLEILASGLRTPNGIGIGVDNEIFIADNQGDWIPACKILHLKPGAFYGNYSADLYKIGTLKEQPPVVWLPQNEIGNSTSQPALLNMGPYRNQIVHGDVTHGGLKRVFVEKIKGEYQGVAFPFTQGLEGGTNRLVVGPDSNLYVGMIGNPGNWGQSHHEWFGLEALKWNGRPVFDILAIRSLKTGFEIEFTEPLPEKIRNPENLLRMASWTYIPTMRYGGPKTEPTEFKPESIRISKDRTRLLVDIRKLKEGFVYHFEWNDSLQSQAGRTLWSTDAWYTLNQVSDQKRNPEDFRLLLWNKPGEVRKPEYEKAPSAVSVPAKTIITKPDPKAEAEAILEGGRLVGPSGCLACHKQNEKVLGPAFRLVAQKYKSDPANVKKLVDKVYNGGTGVWGDYAMAPQSHLKKDKIEKMIRWILSLK